jgi:uncharacterized caspase-like protein
MAAPQNTWIRAPAAWAIGKRILFCIASAMLVLILFGAWAEAKERVALVIGNSTYQHIGQLKNPENDARLIASKLRKIGFDVIERVNLSKADFDNTLIEFSNAASSLDTGTGESIALFFYAGHGVQVKDINYLIPVDAKIEREAEIRIRAVSVNNVLATLDESGAGVTMIILDACRDNPFPAVSRSTKRGLAKIEEIEGSVIAYSTSPGQVARDGAGENSPYSEALARMVELADLTIEDVFRGVNGQVKEATSGTQLPWLSLSLSDKIYLAGRTASPESTQVPVGSGALTGTETLQVLWARAVEKNTVEAYAEVNRRFPNSEEAKRAVALMGIFGEEKNWEIAKQANTIGSYNIYILKYPAGTYLSEAKQRLAALQTGTQQADGEVRSSMSIGDLRDIPGFDAYGFDYEKIPDISYDACKQACAANSKCKALTYNRAHSLCFLKAGAQNLVATTDADAAVAGHLFNSLRRMSIRALQRTEIDGYDYADKQDISFFECLLQCENDIRCQAVSWVKKERWCLFKSDVGRQSYNRKVDSGVK